MIGKDGNASNSLSNGSDGRKVKGNQAGAPSAQVWFSQRGQPIAIDRRNLVNAIFCIVRSGCACRLLLSDIGPWQTVYGHFRRWSRDWTWTFIHDTLRYWSRKTSGRNVAPAAAMIDNQSVETPDLGEEHGYDAGKKISGRTRYVVVGVLRLICDWTLSAAVTRPRDSRLYGNEGLLSEASTGLRSRGDIAGTLKSDWIIVRR